MIEPSPVRSSTRPWWRAIIGGISSYEVAEGRVIPRGGRDRLLALFDRLFPLGQMSAEIAYVGLPFGGLVRVRVQTKRGFNVGKAVLAVPKMHFVVPGVRVGPRIVAVVRDSHLDFGERRPPLLLAGE